MMNILVTGAGGFVGKNLVENLKNIKEGKNRARPGLLIGEIYEYDKGSDLLEEYCQKADFIFHLAGVNRPRNAAEFEQGNLGALACVLETLKKCGNIKKM